MHNAIRFNDRNGTQGLIRLEPLAHTQASRQLHELPADGVVAAFDRAANLHVAGRGGRALRAVFPLYQESMRRIGGQGAVFEADRENREQDKAAPLFPDTTAWKPSEDSHEEE